MSGHVAGRIQLFAEDVTQHYVLSTKSTGAFDLSQRPTYARLGLECTKSMGSRYAVNKFMRAAATHGLNYELIPSTSKISFANSETTSVHQAVNMWFPTKTPMFTVVDIVEQGRVPILFSLKQMKHLNMKVGMRPNGVLRTCEALGFHHAQARQASPSHIVLILRQYSARLHVRRAIVMMRFLVSSLATTSEH